MRSIREADQPFLRDLYAQSREAEMAPLPWPPFQKAAFLADQFRLQHLHFVLHFPNADFWVVEQRRRPIGRFYLDRSKPMWRLIEIGLVGETQGLGLGGALLGWAQELAMDRSAEGIDLNVVVSNTGARNLYESLGFVAEGPVDGAHQRLVWRTTQSDAGRIS